MSVDRRSFLRAVSLTCAGAGSAAVLGPIAQRTALADTTGPNTSLYTAVQNSHAMTSGNSIVGSWNGTDYSSLSNALTLMIQDWVNNGVDGQLRPAWNAMTPSFIDNSKIDLNGALANFQIYNPQVTAAQLQQILNSMGGLTQSDLQGIITTLQQEGMVSFFNQINRYCQSMATSLGASASIAYPTFRPVPPRNPGSRPGWCGVVPSTTAKVIGTGLSILGYLSKGVPALGIGALAPFTAEFWGPALAIGGLASFGWGLFTDITC